MPVTAVVYGARSAEEVGRYLPSNYRVVYAVSRDGRLEVVISGRDDAGWTMDDYVIPRLASGLMRVEVDAS